MLCSAPLSLWTFGLFWCRMVSTRLDLSRHSAQLPSDSARATKTQRASSVEVSPLPTSSVQGFVSESDHPHGSAAETLGFKTCLKQQGVAMTLPGSPSHSLLSRSSQ
eukprot:s33_g3.t1